MEMIKNPTDFLWDKGNKDKNLLKHQVSNEECEEVFFDQHKKIIKDVIHSNKEKRYILLGNTKKARLLFIVFTIRNNKVRVISARDLNKKERELYEKYIKITKI